MIAVTARRVVMTACVWMLCALAAGAMLLGIGLTKEDGWLFTVVDVALLFGCIRVAARVWEWSKP